MIDACTWLKHPATDKLALQPISNTVTIVIRRRRFSPFFFFEPQWQADSFLHFFTRLLEAHRASSPRRHKKRPKDKERRGLLINGLCRRRSYRLTEQQWHLGFLWPLLLACWWWASSCWAVSVLFFPILYCLLSLMNLLFFSPPPSSPLFLDWACSSDLSMVWDFILILEFYDVWEANDLFFPFFLRDKVVGKMQTRKWL